MDLNKHLAKSLKTLTPNGVIWVGFSGGLDSTVLLHLLIQQPHLKARINAVHVHHGLSANADAWLSHCQQQCEHWQVPFYSEKVQLNDLADGVEQAARAARYGVYKQYCQSGDSLLLAQHADDQLETFFMRLLRGAGLHGLTAIAAERQFSDNVQLLRPLLSVSRAELEQYVQQHQLNWVEDESNSDSRFERNWWRNEILPVLWRKFPQRKKAVLRSIEQLQQDQQLLDELLTPIINQACIEWRWPSCFPVGLDIQQLNALPEHYKPYVVRGWLGKNGLMQPSQQWLVQLQQDVIQARVDAQPVLSLADWQVQRHKQKLFVFKPHAVETEQSIFLSQEQVIAWSGGVITVAAAQFGMKAGEYTLTSAGKVRGQRLQAKDRPPKTVKAFLQEADIPTALRDSWPVLLQNDHLVSIIGIAQAEQIEDVNGLVLGYLAH